jgi:hypothetical protein
MKQHGLSMKSLGRGNLVLLKASKWIGGRDRVTKRMVWKDLVVLVFLISGASIVNCSVWKAGPTIQPEFSTTTFVNPPSTWSRWYGGLGDDWALSVVQTSDGGYVLAGLTDSSGAGCNDFYLVKTDSAGNAYWTRTYGGSGDDDAYSVIQMSDGGYALAGSTDSFGAGSYDFWLVKTDSAGNMQWNQTYGGAGNDYAYSVVQTSDGGYGLAGYTNSFGGVSYDFWLVKTDSAGNMQWNQTYGGLGDEKAYSLVQTTDGGYALAGCKSYPIRMLNAVFWLVKTDSVGNAQWNQTYGSAVDIDKAYAVVQTADGGYALAGVKGSDFWLVRTDSSGNELWDQAYHGGSYAFANSLVQTIDGGYAVAGYTGSYDPRDWHAWLVKTDSLGSAKWNQTYGGLSDTFAFSVIQTSDGGYAIAGCADSGSGNYDAWLVKTDSLGNLDPVAAGGGGGDRVPYEN